MQKARKERETLERAIGYCFHDRTLLETALTHSSYSNEAKGKGIFVECNERLEFLGDSVLQIIASEYLFTDFSDCPEGELTRMRSEIVRGTALSVLAEKIGLGVYLNLGNGEEQNGGRENENVLADAFEALLAAMYLDCGKNKDRVAEFLLPLLREALIKFEISGATKDYKTLLQQVVQQGGSGDILQYAVTDERGPDHNKTFTVEVRLNSNLLGTGVGRSKKSGRRVRKT